MALRNSSSRDGPACSRGECGLDLGFGPLPRQRRGAGASLSPHRHYATHHAHHSHYTPARARASCHYARREPRVRSVATARPSSPAFSALVVDANSGRTLYSADENGLRHPASITKVMTLYLLFEQLEKGTMTLQTRIPISEHAAAQEPSKLGLPPGRLDQRRRRDQGRRHPFGQRHRGRHRRGGRRQSESNFADMMTRKAHALGMSNTLYRNASGLPNDEQVTTARDLAILGRSLEERFPRYFRYFSTAQFEYRRRDHRQPQSSPRPHRRRRRHQDRLHPRFRVQSADLGPSRRTVADRRRHGRPLRRQRATGSWRI